MPIYRYTASDSQQHPVDGHLEAASVEAARQQLQGQGLEVMELMEVASGPLEAPPARLGAEEAQRFVEELAELSAAGVPLPAGLRAAAEEGGHAGLTAALLQVADQLERGRTLEEAVSSSELALPDYTRRLIAAAARTGPFGPSLLELLDRGRDLAALRRRIWQSLAYPAIVAGLAFAVVVSLSSILGGAFERIYCDFGARLPAITVLFLNWRFVAPRLTLLLVLVAAGLFLLLRFGVSPLRRRRWLAAVPLLGPMGHWLSLLEWLGLLRALLQNQVPLCEALQLAGDGNSDANVAQLSRILAEGVARGRSLSQAMTAQRAMPASLVPLIRWGEQLGTLPESLEISGELLEERVHMRFVWLRMALPPLMFLAVGCGIVTMVIALFLPLIALIQAMTGGGSVLSLG